MAFQDIKPVQKAADYLDIAFSRAKKRAAQIRGKSRSKKQEEHKLQKVLELERLNTVKATLAQKLDEVLNSFPNIEELTPFYKELLSCYTYAGQIRKSLGAVNWAKHKIIEFCNTYSKQIKASSNASSIITLRKECYGRLSSAIRQVNRNLLFLEEARRIMKEFPVIKEMPTVCIAGFPNVGKSTLLSKLTTAKPKIENYSFTTKQLNLGYAELSLACQKASQETPKEPRQETPKESTNLVKVQFIDAPGTLNRFDKMNNIEKQAYIALRHCDIIIYVFDPTQQYPLELQESLLKKIKKHKKPVICYVSKTDLPIEKQVISCLINKYKKYKITADIHTLEKELSKDLACFIN